MKDTFSDQASLELDLVDALPPVDEHLYQVRVGAIADPVATAPAVAKLLEVELAIAQRICMKMPGVMLTEVSHVEAERVAKALRAVGVRAEARIIRPDPTDAPSVQPPDPRAAPTGRPGPSRPAPSRPGPSRPGPSRPAPSRPAPAGAGPGDSFWLQVPVAFLAPFVGRSWILLVLSGLVGVGLLTLLLVAPILLKLVGGLFLCLVGVGLTAETFGGLARAALMRDDDAWLPNISGNLPTVGDLLVRGILLMVVGFLLSAVPVFILSKTDSTRAFLIAQAILLVYWPMALAAASLSGRTWAALDAPWVLRGIFIAPVEYLVVCVLGLGSIFLTAYGIMSSSFGEALLANLSDASAGTISERFAMYATYAFMLYAGFGYYHGFMGYLMGALVRSKSERFDYLTS